MSFYKHGMAGTRFYRIWNCMKNRCLNSNVINYKYYGERGITICDKWLDFAGFQADMFATYQDGLEIDRIDNNKGYYKDNCRWVNHATNQRNKRKQDKTTSEYIGVYWNSGINKWLAQLSLNGKNISIGYYDTPEIANTARLAYKKQKGI